jgi:hypothetical protein
MSELANVTMSAGRTATVVLKSWQSTGGKLVKHYS